MKLLAHPLTHRVAKHTHDYGLYLSLAVFQKEFFILMGVGAIVIVTLSIIQFHLGLEEEK